VERKFHSNKKKEKKQQQKIKHFSKKVDLREKREIRFPLSWSGI